MTGIIKENLAEAIYRKEPYLSVSQVKAFASSETPWHFFKRQLCKDRPVEFNPHFVVGTVLHARVELGDRFEDEYALAPKGIVRGGPSWRKFMAENKGKTPVRKADWELTEAMYKSMMSHSGALELLKDAKHEESFFGYYKGIATKETIAIKGRTDIRVPGSHILDVKTAKSGCPWEHRDYFGVNSFKKAVINGKLHWQAALYDHLVREATSQNNAHEFLFLAIEKTYPFDVSLHVLSPKLLQRGYDEVFPALEELAQRIKDNDWPRYGNKIYTVEDYE